MRLRSLGLAVAVVVLTHSLACSSGGGSSGGGSGTSGGGSGSTGGGTASSGGGSAGGGSAGGGSAGGGTASSGGGSSASDGGPVVLPASGGTFNVPAAGGAVVLPGGSTDYALTFPSTASGKAITLAPGAASDIGWDAGDFSDVIKLGPDGTTFNPPVVVKPANGQLLMFTTKLGAGRGDMEALRLNTAGDGLELKHFSALVLLPPGKSCDSTSGWSATPNAAICQGIGGGATTQLTYGCKGYSFCTLIAAQCCVTPAVAATRTDCQLGDPGLYVDVRPSGVNGTSNPWCDADAGVKPACPSTVDYVDGGPGVCSATALIDGDRWGFDCDPGRYDAGGTVCVCTKNGAPTGTSSVNYCNNVVGSVGRCASRVCN